MMLLFEQCCTGLKRGFTAAKSNVNGQSCIAGNYTRVEWGPDPSSRTHPQEQPKITVLISDMDDR